MFSLGEIGEIIGGTLLGDGALAPSGFAVDSRRVVPGDLFFALPGARTDGHAFLDDAFARGACGAVVAETRRKTGHGRTSIVVRDVPEALRAVAGAWRERFSIPLVAVTGSNGKTTTKALLAHLAGTTYHAYAAPENYNTAIGLPLAILSMPPAAELGAFELGADRPGDIAPLVRLLRPSAGIVTSAGPSHLEAFETVERVADEKWDLVRGLPDGAPAYVNADSPELWDLAETGQRPGVVRVGLTRGDVRGRILSDVPRLAVAVDDPPLGLETELVGVANATNLLLAALCAYELGVPARMIEERAATFRPVPHRMERRAARFGILLDDTYNANPSSMSFALRTLSAFKSAPSRVAVIGDMLELGEGSTRMHHEIAQLSLELGIDAVYPVGERMVGAFRASADPRVRFRDRDQVAGDIVEHLADTSDAVVLVKASRDLRLEEIVRDLLRLAPGQK